MRRYLRVRNQGRQEGECSSTARLTGRREGNQLRTAGLFCCHTDLDIRRHMGGCGYQSVDIESMGATKM